MRHLGGRISMISLGMQAPFEEKDDEMVRTDSANDVGEECERCRYERHVREIADQVIHTNCR